MTTKKEMLEEISHLKHQIELMEGWELYKQNVFLKMEMHALKERMNARDNAHKCMSGLCPPSVEYHESS